MVSKNDLQIAILFMLAILLLPTKASIEDEKCFDILNMTVSMMKQQLAKSLVLHFDGGDWQRNIKSLYKTKNAIIPIASVTNQTYLCGSKSTMNLYVKKSLNELHDIFASQYPCILNEVLLVQLHADEKGSIKDILSDFYLQYDSLLFPFYYNNVTNVITIFEAYKIHINDTNVEVLNYAYWTPLSGFMATSSLKIWQRRQDLQGHFFRIAAIPNQPYITVADEGCESSDCFKGIYPDVWHTVKNVMNFTFKLTRPQDMAYGTLINGTWNGMIRQLIDDEVDISPMSYAVSQIRSQVVDFLVPIAESHQRLFVVNPADSLNWMAFFDPLTWTSWGVLVVFIVTTPFVIASLMYFGRAEPAHDEFSLTKSFCFVGGAMLIAKPWSHTPKILHNRIAFFAIMMGGTLVFWHWEAMIISYLAVRTIELPFNSLEELLTKTDVKLVVQPGTAYMDTFRYSSNDLLQRIYKERIEPYAETYPRVKKELSEYILSHSGFAFFDNFYASRSYSYYIDCKIVDVPIAYFPVQFAYAIQKHSPYFEAFWYHMNKLKENGEFRASVLRYETPPQVCPDYNGQPLGLSQCFTAYIILIGGFSFSLLWLLIEYITPQRYYRKFASLPNRSFVGMLSVCRTNNGKKESMTTKLRGIKQEQPDNKKMPKAILEESFIEAH